MAFSHVRFFLETHSDGDFVVGQSGDERVLVLQIVQHVSVQVQIHEVSGVVIHKRHVHAWVQSHEILWPVAVLEESFQSYPRRRCYVKCQALFPEHEVVRIANVDAEIMAVRVYLGLNRERGLDSVRQQRAVRLEALERV